MVVSLGRGLGRVEGTGRVSDGPALPRGRDDEVVEQAAKPNATADAIANARLGLEPSVSNTQDSRHDRHESVRRCTASGETRSWGPGALFILEDTSPPGHGTTVLDDAVLAVVRYRESRLSRRTKAVASVP